MLLASLAMTVCVLLFSAQPLHAQVDTGSIAGTVTDSSSAVVGGAKVTLTNEGTSAALSTTADAGGFYTFTPVRIGTYTHGVLPGISDHNAKEYRGQCGIGPGAEFYAETWAGERSC